MFRSLLVLLLLIAVDPARADGDVETVRVTVTRLAHGGGWRVHYQLDHPADRLRFFTGFRGRRAATWRAGKGIELTEEDGHELLRRSDGRPLREAVVEFASDPIKLDRHYPLNRRFTDGSEWLNTAYLYAGPLRGGIQERKAEFDLRFVSDTAEPILVAGSVHKAAARWRERFAEGLQPGTFVYFGAIAPVQTPSALVVVDPGLPPHLRAAFERHVPTLFSYYAERTGYALPRAEILITYAPEANNRGYSGDTLGNLIDFHFEGPDWAVDETAGRRSAFHFLAHEAAHRWNGERFGPADGDVAPWMHEGGAEAFALLAARDLGVIDAAAFRGEIENALNQCTDGLVGTSLQAAAGKNASGPSYACGLVMNMLVDAQLAAKGGLFAFWRALFKAAEASADRYTLDLYFATLEREAGRRTAALLRRIWSLPLKDPVATLRAELSSRGALATVSAPTGAAGQIYARKAMAFVMADDCRGAMNFTTEADHFRIGGLPACAVLKDDEYRVVALAGQPILNNGAAVYDAVAKLCAAGKAVELKLHDGTTRDITCHKPVRARTPYLSLTAWPSAQTKGPAVQAGPSRHRTAR